MDNEIVNIPITGTIDLHGFQPKEIKEVVNEYLIECFNQNIYSGRIIHGKGIGTQQKIVHAVLSNHPYISDFSIGNETSGGWGSTTFFLKK